MNIHQLQQYLFNNLWYGENGHEQNLKKEGIVLRSLVMPDGTKVWGIDISHWNLPPVNLKRMVELYNLKFVIIKGCDGSVNSRYYFEHVQAAKEAGIPWGMYVWLYPANKVNMDAQVNAWYNRANTDFPPLGVFIDAETTYYGGVLANPTSNDLRSAHDKWKLKSLVEATTYTSPYYAATYLTSFDWSREPLWIAHYGVIPPSTPNHEFHQFTSHLDGHQLDPNGNAELDGNYFNGTETDFYNKYGGAVPPPPTGTIMKQGILTPTTTSLRIRSGPSMAYPQISGIYQGDIVYGEIDSVSGWLHVSSIKRGNNEPVAFDGWCSAHPDYITITDYIPPSTSLPDLKVTIEAVGYPTTVVIIQPNA
jgi:GH25 family lysozyme M1 (1,4-beta-N-acetylmuramidase)